RASPDEAAVARAQLPGREGAAAAGVKITAEQLSDADNRTLLMFELQDSPAAPRPTVEIDVRHASSDEYESLERELQRTKDDLQSALEASQTTNEELQATNEQLTASNEELQSTNEELHSVNEELYTVNAEHQRKIDELTELTDDMDNLLNSTNIHTIFLDRELAIRRFTPGIGDTFNLIPQDVGRRINDFTHNIQFRGLVYAVRKVLETSEPFEREVADKRGGWYLLRILPYVTRGQVDGAVVTLINITSLKQAESKLAELSEIVEHSDDAIFRQDPDGAVRTWNRGAERLFGIKAAKVLGNHVSMLGLQCGDFGFEQMLGLVIGGQSLDHVEARRLRSRGKVSDLALSISPIRDASGKVIGVSTIARDVTKQKQAEAEVREAVRRRDEFLAMLSHELRNPLAAVLNATDLLSEAGGGGDQAAGGGADVTNEAKGVIEHNVRHVARILDDLLDVSRITNDKIELHREVVDLCPLMIDVVECVQHRVDAKRQELHVQQPAAPVYVEGDVGRLQQMQVNLLVNASKYTGAGGRIDYRVVQEGSEAVIAVSDTGEGIAPELMQRIFEPFVQAEQTLDRSQGGMGLGLTLVSKVAEAHGGAVIVDSDGPKRGSTFSIRLPVTSERPRRQADSRLAEIDGMRLYIVEDNDGVRNMLARTLELKGFCVETAANGREALDAIDAFAPSVAVVDIGLPDLNGYEVAQEIRKRGTHADTLLVALTGYGRQQDRQKALDSGFDIHLVKPLDPNELLRAVAERYAGAPN
ncbi:MAG: PAS domain-containing protein, partial [Planctomycetota bacterium]